jgi:hypothetical protein
MSSRKHKARSAQTKLAMTRRRNAAKRLRAGCATPAGRLGADGCSSPLHMNRRALWLATEWHLPRWPKIGRTPTLAVAKYCKTHGVSLEWLLEGDLKGLQWMMQARRKGQAAPTPESLREKLARLSESEQDYIRKMVDHLIAGPTP